MGVRAKGTPPDEAAGAPRPPASSSETQLLWRRQGRRAAWAQARSTADPHPGDRRPALRALALHLHVAPRASRAARPRPRSRPRTHLKRLKRSLSPSKRRRKLSVRAVLLVPRLQFLELRALVSAPWRERLGTRTR